MPDPTSAASKRPRHSHPNPRAARRIVLSSIAAAAVLILGAGILRGLRESARAAVPSAAASVTAEPKGK